MKRVYLDTETTGVEPGQICQISYLVEENDTLIKRVNQYFKVDYIEPDAAKINGLSVELLERISDGKIFADRAEEIYNDLSNALVIGHNISFDESFIHAEMARLKISLLFLSKFCTMTYFTPIMHLPGRNGKIKKPRLSEVLHFLGISEQEAMSFTQAVFGPYAVAAHDARYDSVAVYLITKKLIDLSGLNLDDYCKPSFTLEI